MRQALAGGVVAGYTVDDLKVTVFDGKTHSVDGKEVAFTVAGRKAAIEAIRAAKPILLEPIVAIEILAPEAAIGDLTGDLSGRRGHVTGTDSRGHGQMVIAGEVPLAELNDYQSRLKSLTGGQGSYRIDFARYAAVPPQLQQQLAEAVSSCATTTNKRRGHRWRPGDGPNPRAAISRPFAFGAPARQYR